MQFFFISYLYKRNRKGIKNMNLEKLLAENLLRFGVKNLDNPIGYHVKFLMEQDPGAALKQIQNDAAANAEFQKFQSTANSQYKNVILIKTQKLVPINNEPITLEDYFYNNFVTLELGVKDPKTLKAKLDGVITKLETAGAKLDNPKTIIEIVSTATPDPASTGPNKRDFPNQVVPADHKKLDHTYGGQLVYDKTGAVTAKSIEWAKTNGNNYLAQQRGESAKKYLESKGVKASIIVKAVTGAERRQFQITAKQEGTQKVINPIGVPDIKWSYGVTVDIVMKSAATNTVMGNQVPFIRVSAGGNLGTMQGVIPRNSSVDAENKAMAKIWSQGTNVQMAVKAAKLGGISPNFGAFKEMFQLQPSSLMAQSSAVAGAGGTTQESAGAVGPFLSSVGHFMSGQLIVAEFNNILSPLVAQLVKTNIADKLQLIFEANKELPGPNNPAKDKESEKAAYDKLFALGFHVDGTGNLQDLVTAAVAAGIQGASATKSTDPAYWQNAYFFDYTTKNAQGIPSYGKLNKQNAAAFFEGAGFQ
jgi:hypothetical protein